MGAQINKQTNQGPKLKAPTGESDPEGRDGQGGGTRAKEGQ